MGFLVEKESKKPLQKKRLFQFSLFKKIIF